MAYKEKLLFLLSSIQNTKIQCNHQAEFFNIKPGVSWWGNLRERDRWVDPGVNGRIMFGFIFKKWDMGMKTGLGWLRIGRGGGRL
jgi:hypothetical protein